MKEPVPKSNSRGKVPKEKNESKDSDMAEPTKDQRKDDKPKGEMMYYLSLKSGCWPKGENLVELKQAIESELDCSFKVFDFQGSDGIWIVCEKEIDFCGDVLDFGPISIEVIGKEIVKKVEPIIVFAKGIPAEWETPAFLNFCQGIWGQDAIISKPMKKY
jgi:hypothetical protein